MWAKRLYDPLYIPPLYKTQEAIRECLEKVSVHGKKLGAGPIRGLVNFYHREQSRVFTRITRSTVPTLLNNPVHISTDIRN
jgi:hypothetical protein